VQGSGVPILDGFLLRLHSIDLSQASSANGLPHALHAHSISFNDLGQPNVSGLSMSKHERLPLASATNLAKIHLSNSIGLDCQGHPSNTLERIV
jgi:hypothetical protein